MRQPLQGCRKRGQLEIVISNSGSVPIYEQIEAQIKDAIMTGELQRGSISQAFALLPMICG